MKHVLLALSIAAVASCQAAPPATQTSQNTAEAIGIPGPRTCFWLRGPYNTDPYLNVAYPDGGAFYWSANVSIPQGATLRLKGQYPHARYMSFVSYRATGQAVESLADYQIAPDAGSSNPYLVGADRFAARRDYSVTVALGASEVEVGDGKLRPDSRRNVLHAPPTPSGALSIVYRIYVNDRDKPVVGGVGLPSVELTLADGKVLTGEAACEALKSRQAPTTDLTALGVPPQTYRELKNQKDRPLTWPAQPSPEWHVQHPRAAVFTIFTGNHEGNTQRGGGEFYPNPDNRYARALISTKFGPVLILRGRMPMIPKTFNGDRMMAGGQLRYWSLCSNQSMVNSRTTDCVFDEEVPLAEDRSYTIIVSKEKDRPRNARPECGLAWVRMADAGDGLDDPDFTLLVVRNMLAAPEFTQSIQTAVDDKDLDKLGDYLPKGQYVMPNVVETLFPCPP